jgi:hypothetical protein
MNAKSIKGKSTEEINSALQQSMADGFKPTLAIVFLSVSQDKKAISDLLDAKGIAIFGATTSGEFIDEVIEKGTMVMLLLDIKTEHFKIYFDEFPEKNYRETARGIAEKAQVKFPKPAFIISGSHLETDAEQLLYGFEDVVGKDVNVFGGMASDDYTFTEQFVFTNGRESNRGIIAMALDESKILIKGKATCGWKAVGTTKTVTKSDGNIVYTIDDKPALDMLMKYLGVELIKDDEKEIVSFVNSWYYPLQLERNNGDSVIRATRFANSKDRSLICTGSVPQGSQIKFSLPPDFDAIETVIAECESIKDNVQQQADALIMFSCVSRHLSFGALIKEEIEQVQNVWNAPMFGFFTYGEYGKSKIGTNEFHNNACCVVVLKEK